MSNRVVNVWQDPVEKKLWGSLSAAAVVDEKKKPGTISRFDWLLLWVLLVA